MHFNGLHKASKYISSVLSQLVPYSRGVQICNLCHKMSTHVKILQCPYFDLVYCTQFIMHIVFDYTNACLTDFINHFAHFVNAMLISDD